MSESDKAAILSAMRSLLLALGGGAVTNGYVTADMLQLLVGLAIAVATAAWGIYEKRTRKEVE
jgi:hypothetical protein